MKAISILLVCAAFSLQAMRLAAQTTEDKQYRRFSTNRQLPATTTAFYDSYGQRPAWTSTANRHQLEQLLAYISQAPYLGLQQQDYLPAVMQTLASLGQGADLLIADAAITTTAIRFFSDVAYGHLDSPPVQYNGPPYQPDCHQDIAVTLAHSLGNNSFNNLLAGLEPATPEYTAIKDKIACFYDVINAEGFTDITVAGSRADTTNVSLRARLRQLEPADPTAIVTNAILIEKLRAAQRMYNLLDDGSLRPSVLKALNVPLAERLRELNRTINQLRWLYCARREAALVIVNIPSCDLVYYRQGKRELVSRVVTGKQSARTPTLCSRIANIILYPYWTVPKRIASRELLPHIQADISYLEQNQFQVLDNKGRIVDPARINWQRLTPGNFPYTLRQGTGCDNAMGIIKLDFTNPYSVYLHDTPWKSLFLLNQRFFSHGCIRVEEAAPLARLLLEEKAPTLDTLISKGTQLHPISLTPARQAWVFVLYNTAWPDEKGSIRFYQDIYTYNK